MTKRKYISWKTKCAAALLYHARLPVPYTDVKQMTENQFLSLFHWDHNILHETGHEDRDKFWNLSPMFIKEHREKTKLDAKIIAKGRRIRKRMGLVELGHLLADAVKDNRASPAEAVAEAMTEGFLRGIQQEKRKIRSRIRSRGFDKTLSKKLDGSVVKREG